MVPLLDLLWILVRFMVRSPQKDIQMGVQVVVIMSRLNVEFLSGVQKSLLY